MLSGSALGPLGAVNGNSAGAIRMEYAAIAAIRKAIELGINWIDTAAIYGEGRSEILVAKALAGIPAADRPIVATKCGRVALGNNEIGKCLRRDSVIAECEASLKRLNVDCIDWYQMHWPEPDEEIEEGWSTLVELKRQVRSDSSAFRITL